MIDFDTHLALTRLYADYALAVDSGQWDLWPDFFADDCSYRLQPRENYDRGFPLSTLAFSSKGMLRDRVYGIKETLFHDPYYQRHVVGAPVVRRVEAGRIYSEANYAVPWALWYANPQASGAEEPPAEVRRQMELYTRICTTTNPQDQTSLMAQVLAMAADQFYAIGLVTRDRRVFLIHNLVHVV